MGLSQPFAKVKCLNQDDEGHKSWEVWRQSLNLILLNFFSLASFYLFIFVFGSLFIYRFCSRPFTLICYFYCLNIYHCVFTQCPWRHESSLSSHEAHVIGMAVSSVTSCRMLARVIRSRHMIFYKGHDSGNRCATLR